MPYYFFHPNTTMDDTTPSAKSLPSLASGSFATGPNDEVATTDIYSIGKNARSIVTSVKEIGLQAQSKLEGFFNDGSELADFLEQGKNKIGLEFDDSTLTKRLLETSSELKGAFNDLTDTLKSNAKLNIVKSQVREIQCTINDVKCMVSAAKVKDIKSLGNFINKYTGKSLFSSRDTGALSGVLASVVAKTQELGIPGAYTSLMTTINDNAILRTLTKTLIPVAIAGKYPNLLRELASGPMGKIVGIFAPGVTQSLLKNFSLTNISNVRRINSFEDILVSIDGISGAWNRSSREGSDEDVFDLFQLMGGSKDFQSLLVSGVQYYYSNQRDSNAHTQFQTPNGAQLYALYGIAGMYQKSTPAALVKKYFPKVALTGTYDLSIPQPATTSRSTVRSNGLSVTDPRILSHIGLSLFS